MASGKQMKATIKLAGQVDPSLAKAIRQAERQAGRLNSRMSSFGTAAAKAGKFAASALATVGAAAGAAGLAIGKAALDSYSSFEQLKGGVETLFGDSSKAVMNYAQDAYRTAGISANQYMEQATAFSASLIQSLGGDTQAAAEYTDRAIQDMSDNANRMGTSIETIQQTYQSLMRGNYAMLDNLRLGYGGTKAELERLVSDAEKLTGQALDPSKFSDVITAIHAVQENLGITGATAEEAAITIEGSINTMKAAWSNWLTGLGNKDADMGALTDRLVDSISNVAKNVGPAVQRIGASMVECLPQALSGAGEVIAPILAEALSTAWNLAAQALGSMGIKLPDMDASAFMGAFQQISDTIGNLVNGPLGQAVANFANSVLPPLMSALSGVLPLLEAIANAVLPPIINYLTPIITLVSQIAAAVIPPLTAAINALNPAIQFVISAVLTLTPIFSGLFSIVQAGGGIIANIAGAILPNLQAGFELIKPAITSVSDVFSVLSGVVQSVAGAIGTVISLASKAVSAVASIGSGIIGGIGSFLGFATGGISMGPGIVGEDPRYPHEYVISPNPAYRAQNIRYWQMAGHMLGVRAGGAASGGASASTGGTRYDFSGMTFSPKVEVRGNASKEDIVAAIRQCEGEFIDFVMDAMARREEAAYA